MKNFLIIPNTSKDKDFSVTDKVVEKLLSFGANVYISSKSYSNVGVKGYESIPDDIELIVVVGGDGSVLDASELAIARNIPILGINLGKVGYLAEVELDNIDILGELNASNYSIEDKMILQLDFEGADEPCERYAVNDVTVSRDSFVHIADVIAEDSIGNALKIRADGVILATPQGSTAYSFSSGGPILAHDVESILMTPVSPHSFFNRSVIFNSSEVIKITNSGSEPLNVFVDGRCVGKLLPGKYCRVRKADKSFKALTFMKNNMFSSLFKKMRVLGDID